MSTTSTITGPAEWMHFYEQGASDEVGATSFSNATTVTASVTSDGNGSPGSSSPVKPTRRRSRASKKVAPTLLNANTSNFRALVQQFTGCPSSRPLFRRGPMNLNFALGNEESSQGNVSASPTPMFGTNYYSQQLDQPQPLQQQQHHMFQGQQNGVLYPTANTDISDGFDGIDHDVSMEEFPAHHYSNEHRNGSYFL